MKRYYTRDTAGYITVTKWAFIDPIVAIIALLVLFSSVKAVGVGEVGVITRFGNVTREWESGVHLKAPWPIEKVTYFDVRTQKEEAKAAAASHDLQDIHATLVVNYHLERGQVGNIFKSVGPEFKERLIDPAVQEVFKAVSAEYTASQLITERPKVKTEAAQLLRDRLEKRGIFIDDLSITNFDFSPEFAKSIEAKQVAAQEAERAKFHLEQANLDAQAQNVQKASLSAELLQKYAIDKWDGKMPTYVGGGSIFNIPLNK